jgi:hypothetical protein
VNPLVGKGMGKGLLQPGSFLTFNRRHERSRIGF